MEEHTSPQNSTKHLASETGRKTLSPVLNFGAYLSPTFRRRLPPKHIQKEAFAQREKRFRISVGTGVDTAIPAYDSLFDRHMKGYFSKPVVRKTLVQNGVIGKNGMVVLTPQAPHKAIPLEMTVMSDRTKTSRSLPEVIPTNQTSQPRRKEPQPGDPFYRKKLPQTKGSKTSPNKSERSPAKQPLKPINANAESTHEVSKTEAKKQEPRKDKEETKDPLFEKVNEIKETPQDTHEESKPRSNISVSSVTDSESEESEAETVVHKPKEELPTQKTL